MFCICHCYVALAVAAAMQCLRVTLFQACIFLLPLSLMSSWRVNVTCVIVHLWTLYISVQFHSFFSPDMRFLQSTLNCTRTKVYRIMVGDLGCLIQAQKLQVEGKLQQMNSCLTASANENVIGWCGDSMILSSCFSSNHCKHTLVPDWSLPYVKILTWSIWLCFKQLKALQGRNSNLYYAIFS